MRTLVLNFSKKYVITNGHLNSKGAGIPEFVRKSIVSFMQCYLRVKKYDIDKERVK